MKNLINNIFKHFDIIFLTFVVVVMFAVNVRINSFSYNNFDFGKFDLGNMNQMLWNTLHGRFMYLTDYFGTNLPRPAMSHVDPILMLFLPAFMLFMHPMTIVYCQIALLLLSAYLIFMLANLLLKSRFESLMVALAYLFYPALGYLTARTGFHGVSAAVPFFLAAFYTFEKMYAQKYISKKLMIWFWVFLVIAMTGKEQISLYVFLYGIFLFLRTYLLSKEQQFSSNFSNTAILVSIVGIVWFVIAFFVIIPRYAHYRNDGYAKFAESLGINNANTRDVGLENYFLSRYDAFGDSYTEVIFGILTKPDLAIKIFFGGDKVDNFNRTFAPMLYLPFFAPQILILAIPDMMMNYLTSSSGIGTSEIQNHRISMLIPIFFIAIIFVFQMIKNQKFKNARLQSYISKALAIALVVMSFKSSLDYQNPVFTWTSEALSKRLPSFVAHAKEDPELAKEQSFVIGKIYKLSALENKDRECAQKVIGLIPDTASVSGPDYLGAHLSFRETYAIFPALYNEADYVIVDIFSKKITNILDLNPNLVNEVVNKVVRDPNYKLEVGCGNLFVYKKIGPHEKTQLLPIQERFKYSEKFSYEIYNGLTVVDYTLPTEVIRSQTANAKFVYLKKNSLDRYFIYLSFLNVDTGYLYQVANLPSFAIKTTQDWKEDYYYIEDVEFVLPAYLDAGKYRMFVGMTNYVKTRNIYLGDVNVK